ncbi:hypothetical protein [Citrobacter freundii]|uniref:hypothetical protein n=1 Tax=Citrobacter freundii TaxID=546 RepID=UPI003B434DF5
MSYIAAQDCAAQGLQGDDDFAHLTVGFHVLMCFNDIIKVDWPPESPDSWYHLS